MQKLGWLPACLYLVIVFFIVEPHENVKVGTDDGYELTKVLLLHHGKSLYSEIWNDQPFFYTAILYLADSILPADHALLGLRMINLLFSCALLTSFYFCLLCLKQGTFAIVGSLALALSPHYLKLSYSVMPEIPAIALVMAGTLCWILFLKTKRRMILGLSWILLVLALLTKFTALVLFPLLLGAALHFQGSQTRWHRVRHACAMGGSAMLAALAMTAIGAGNQFAMLLAPHFSPVDGSSNGVLVSVLGQELWILLLAGVGVVFMTRNRDYFGLLLVASGIGFVTLHEPVWYYYYPFAALGLCYGWTVLLRTLFQHHPIIASAVLAFSMGMWMTGVISSVSELRHQPKLDQDVLLTRLKGTNGKTMFFPEMNIYYYLTGKAPPADLAILSQKRYRYSELSPDRLISRLLESRTDLIAFFNAGFLDLPATHLRLVSSGYALQEAAGGIKIYGRQAKVSENGNTPVPSSP